MKNWFKNTVINKFNKPPNDNWKDVPINADLDPNWPDTEQVGGGERCPLCGSKQDDPGEHPEPFYPGSCPDPFHTPASPGDEGQGKRAVWFWKTSQSLGWQRAYHPIREDARPDLEVVGPLIPRSEVEAVRDELARYGPTGSSAQDLDWVQTRLNALLEGNRDG